MPRPTSLSPDNILRFLQVTRDAASTNEIGAALHVGKAERKALFNLLVKLKKKGLIEELPGGRYRLAGRKGAGEFAEKAGRSTGNDAGTAGSSGGGGGGGLAGSGSTGNVRRAGDGPPMARDEVRGRLVLHHDGYGFVVPDVPMPQLDGDVFIPRDAVEDAMHGDHVLARIATRERFSRAGFSRCGFAWRAAGGGADRARAGAGASVGGGIVSLWAAGECRFALRQSDTA